MVDLSTDLHSSTVMLAVMGMKTSCATFPYVNISNKLFKGNNLHISVTFDLHVNLQINLDVPSKEADSDNPASFFQIKSYYIFFVVRRTYKKTRLTVVVHFAEAKSSQREGDTGVRRVHYFHLPVHKDLLLTDHG